MTATDLAAEPFRPRLARHLDALGRLAWPVMLSRAGILLMAMADAVMLGRYDTFELGAASVALGLFIPVMVTCVGLQMGVISIIARRAGAGRMEDCVDAWRRALPWAATTGLVGSALMLLGGPVLRLIGQSPELAAAGGAVSIALAPGVVLQVLYVACAFYLEGTGRPRPALYAMIAANLVNVALNWLLIYGNAGAPELGAVGSAIATSLVRLFLFAAMLIYLLRLPEIRAPRLAGRRPPGFPGPGFQGGGFCGPGGWRAGAEMRRLGGAAAVSVLAETSAFGALAQIAGLVGPTALAAYSIAHNVEATIFMTALGLSVATGVRVGREAGSGAVGEAAFAGWTGLGACVALIGGIGLAVAAGIDGVAAFYTDDAAVALAAVPVLLIAMLAAVPDGMSIVMGSSVRALGDAYVAAALYVAAFWGVMVPLGWFLALGLGWGAEGLMSATLVGAAVSALLQAARFAALTRRGRRVS